jgi:hypothetical protein
MQVLNHFGGYHSIISAILGVRQMNSVRHMPLKPSVVPLPFQSNLGGNARMSSAAEVTQQISASAAHLEYV